MGDLLAPTKKYNGKYYDPSYGSAIAIDANFWENQALYQTATNMLIIKSLVFTILITV